MSSLRRIRPSISADELVSAIDPSKLGPNSPLLEILKLKRRHPSRDLEHQEQVALFDWARRHEHETPELQLLFAVPNFTGAGRWRAKHGWRLKAEGRKPGVPDVWLPVARGGFHGLVVEMKSGKNKPTLEQRAWLERLAQEGFRAVIAYSAADAQAAITQYLTLTT